jgi:hypothetical protein
MSERFYTELNKTKKSSKNTVFLSNEKYDEILYEESLLKNGQKKKKSHAIIGCFKGIYLFLLNY